MAYAAYRFEKGRKQAVEKILEEGISDLGYVERSLDRENMDRLMESVRDESTARGMIRTYGSAFENMGHKFGVLVAEVTDEEEYLRDYKEWEIDLMESYMEDMLRESLYTESHVLAEGYEL